MFVNAKRKKNDRHTRLDEWNSTPRTSHLARDTRRHRKFPTDVPRGLVQGHLVAAAGGDGRAGQASGSGAPAALVDSGRRTAPNDLPWELFVFMFDVSDRKGWNTGIPFPEIVPIFQKLDKFGGNPGTLAELVDSC